MSGRGRPVRFLAVVAAGWVGARVAILWPRAGPVPPAAETRMRAAEAGRAGLMPTAPVQIANLPAGPVRVRPSAPPRAILPPAPAVPTAGLAYTELEALGLGQYGAVEIADMPLVALPEAGQPMTIAPMRSRWSASAWLMARAGTGLGAAPGAGQLGGSQGGIRLSYLLVPKRRIAAFARVAAPLAGKGAEGAVGLEWQPGRAPVRLVVEQRFGLDGTRGGAGLGLITGIYTRTPGDFTLEAYGQAGTIRRARVEPYADGAVRAMRVVAASGRVRLALGGGAWGAAQRNGQRLDLGPSAMLAVPLGRQTVRVALDWRQRVAGAARPGSGGALTIGSDF